MIDQVSYQFCGSLDRYSMCFRCRSYLDNRSIKFSQKLASQAGFQWTFGSMCLDCHSELDYLSLKFKKIADRQRLWKNHLRQVRGLSWLSIRKVYDYLGYSDDVLNYEK